MSNNNKARFGDVDLWIRFVYMVLFALLTALSRLVVCLIALLQFLLVLFSGEDNRNLRSFGNSLSRWTFDTYRFLTFNSEQKPFPFMDWPQDAVPVEQSPLQSEGAGQTVIVPRESDSDSGMESGKDAGEQAKD